MIITCKYKLFPDSQGDANAYDGFENKADMQACQDFCDQTASCVAAQYTNTDCYLYTESQFSSLSSVSGTLYMEKVCESSGKVTPVVEHWQERTIAQWVSSGKVIYLSLAQSREACTWRKSASLQVKLYLFVKRKE